MKASYCRKKAKATEKISSSHIGEFSAAAAEALMMLQRYGGDPVPVYGIDEHGHCRCHLGANCDSAGKHPVGGVHNNVSTVEAIAERGPEFNWGLLLGRKYVGLDDDTDDGSGITSLETEVGEKLPRTAAIRTGGGHKTLLFTIPSWLPKIIPLLKTPHGNVDFLGWPTITVLPGSKSGKGKYSWDGYPPEVGMAELPASFYAWIEGKLPGNKAAQHSPEPTPPKPPPRGAEREKIEDQCNTVNTCVAHICVAQVSHAIERRVPDIPGIRWNCLFGLARSVKAIPEFSNATEEQLRPIVEAWYQKAKPAIRTKDIEVSHRDFLKAYRDVKFPAGISGKLASLVDPRLGEMPLNIRVGALCAALQEETGDAPFFAPCRSFADVLGANHAAISRVLKDLTRDGVLKNVFDGWGHRRRASEYRYIYRGEE